MATYTSTLAPNVKTFVDGVLNGIGAPINNATEQAMLNWLANEQGGVGLPDFTQDQGNPLGVLTPDAQAAGRTGDVGGGVSATVSNLLSSSNYTNVVAAFRAGKSTLGIDQQIVASPWNGSHYGGITTFLKKAGVAAPSGATFSTVPPPTASNEQVVAGDTTPGCNSKGNVFGEGGVLGVGSFSFTYCELKALTGGLMMAAGATIIVIGMSTLIIGGLGTKPLTYLGSATGVGRVTGAASARRQRRRSSSESEESETEEPAEAG